MSRDNISVVKDSEPSERELQLLRLLASDMQLKAAAKIMGISPKTAETFRIKLGRRAGVHTATALGVWGMRKGYIT